jgi:hypothetical protein
MKEPPRVRARPEILTSEYKKKMRLLFIAKKWEKLRMKNERKKKQNKKGQRTRKEK